MKTLMFIYLCINYFLSICDVFYVECWKFDIVPLSDLTLINKEGEKLWEALSENVKLPRYGTCWKEAVNDLQIGCKSLSEDIQSELALRFADCFLQMSGYEPITCRHSRDVCLRNLSDRAFNAYTEFYTHTQSICYFLQSQIWHEEAQETIQKLSDASIAISEQLDEASQIQKNILNEQKESLVLQHNLLDNGKMIASALELSEEKISNIMTNFQNSANEQKKVLVELFEKINLLRSWFVGEITWVNSVLFYMASMIVGYLFTCASRTKQARIYILITLTINYFIERFIYTYMYSELNNNYSGEYINSCIWLSRKTFIFVSVIALIYSTLVYCDYNVVNHELLIEIKNQNKKILHHFELDSLKHNRMIRNNYSTEILMPHMQSKINDSFYNAHSVDRCNILKDFTISPIHISDSPRKNHRRSNCSERASITIDDIDNVSVISEKSEPSEIPVERERRYNLRSSRQKIRLNHTEK